MILSNITKTYLISQNEKLDALVNVSLNIPNKGMIYILGKSGSGKSTLLNIIGGLDKPTSGEFTVFNQNISNYSNKQLEAYRSTNVGFIFQEFNLIETITIGENIALSLELQGEKFNKDKIEKALKSVDLEGYASRMPNTLSGGQKQRIAIARAIVKSPQIILADEPTGSLDSETSEQIIKLLKKISEDHLVLIVSHDRELAEIYGDTIIELKDGKVVAKVENNLEIKKQNNDSLNIKSPKLPYYRSLQLATHNLRLKRFKLLLTLVITILTFILLSISDSLGNYNLSKQSVISMYDSNQSSIVLKQFLKTEDNFRFVNMSTEKITELESNYDILTFVPIMKEFEIGLIDLIDYQTAINSDLYPTTINGGISLSENLLLKLDYSLVAGKLPEHADEVAISLYLYNTFKNYKYKTQDKETININQPSDMLGLKIYNHEYDFKIVGIIDTKIDINRYKPIFDDELNPIHRLMLMYELNSITNGNIHNMLYMYEGYHDNNYISHFDSRNEFRKTYLEVNTEDEIVASSFRSQFSKFNHLNDNNIIWLKTPLTFLSENQVILPASSIRNTDTTYQTIKTLKNQLITDFVTKKYHEIQEEYEEKELVPYEVYLYYVTDNPYHPGITGIYFEELALKTWIENEYSGEFIKGTIQSAFSSEELLLDIEVVGFYEDINGDDLYKIGYVVSDNLFDKFVDEFYLYPYTGVIAILSGKQRIDRLFISEILQTSNSYFFEAYNPVLSVSILNQDSMRNVSKVAFYIGIFLAVISSLQLFNFITSSINYKKKEIGILRALGARINDVLYIFMNEAFLIALISAISTTICCVVFYQFANLYLRNLLDLNITLFIFGFRQILIIYSIAFLTSFISSVIPVYRYSKNNPIDTIRSL